MDELEILMDSLHNIIDYWSNQYCDTPKEKLEGLCFSILCILDGVSGSYDGNIDSIAEMANKENIMLHEIFFNTK